MANYSTSWTLPPSCMPCDSSFKGVMPPQSSSEALLEKQSPHDQVGLPQKQGRDDGILYVTIHQAKHIHNICIYGNQDVYAKFLLTHCQDAVYPTRPVKAGGQNPVFNQSLEIPISGRDTVLKCELWMMSCAQNYLEDQLLGFALVPLNTLYGKGEQTHEFCLTSTDLFYTPAGTVHLSLSYIGHNSIEVGSELQPVENKASWFCCPSPSSFHESMLDCCQQSATSTSMSKVEFVDLEAADEGQHLVSMYYQLSSGASFDELNDSSSSSVHSGHAEIPSTHARHGSFSDKAQLEFSTCSKMKDPSRVVPLVHVHASSVSSVDDDMVVSPREEDCMHVPSYFGGFQKPCELSEITNVSVGERLVQPSVEMQVPAGGLLASKRSLETSVKEMAEETHGNLTCPTEGVVPFSVPLVNTVVEPETNINQEHFVDLYLRSMQQFTDKLADMKFSFGIDAKDLAALRSVQVDRNATDGRKEGSKLYYGSRAFY